MLTKNRVNKILALLLTLALVACSVPVPTPTPKTTPTPAPTEEITAPAPTKAKEKASPTRAPEPPAMPVALPPAPPIVLSHRPATGAEHPVDAPIEIAFNAPMDERKTAAAFAIEPNVEGEISWDENSLVFTPAAPLERDAVYRVTIDGAESAAGLPMNRAVEFTVQTVGYLEVAHVQPAVDTEDIAVDARILVMFNRPVVPLTTLGQIANLPEPLTFMPPLTGKGEWLNTSIYTFTPDELAPATTYKARVAAGLRDSTGAELVEDFTWTFSTRKPAVIYSAPTAKSIYASPYQTVTVTFNQPMDRESAHEGFYLINKNTEQVVEGKITWTTAPVMIREDVGEYYWGEPSVTTITGESLIFTPAEPLELDTAYMATMNAGARAANRAAQLENSYEWEFKTIKYPEIDRTDPKDGEKSAELGGLQIYYTSPMDPESVTFSIVPSVTNVYTYWGKNNMSLRLSFATEPDTEYKVTLDRGARGRYGHEILRSTVVRFRTQNLPPTARLINRGDIGTYNAYTQTLAFVQYRNVEKLNLRLYSLSRAELMDLLGEYWWDLWDRFQPKEHELLEEWTQSLKAPNNQTLIARVDLAERITAPGIYVLEVNADGGSRQVMVVSRYNITLKRGEREALAWVTDLRTGAPAAAVPVTFYYEGAEIAACVTDREGMCVATYDKLDDMWQPFYAFAGDGTTSDADFAMTISRWDEGIAPWNFKDVNGEFVGSPYRSYVYTDRPIYRPGQTVYYKAIIREDNWANYSLPPAGEKLIAMVMNDRGDKIHEEELTLNDMGTVNGEFVLGDEASLGYYSVDVRFADAAESDYSARFGTGFQVAEYRKPEYEVRVTTDKDDYVNGDTINVTAEALYYFGGPVADAQVHWAVIEDAYYFNWAGEGWYDFTDYDWTQRYYYGEYGGFVAEGDATTDAEGRVTFQIPTDIADKINSQRYEIEVNVTDVNDQVVSSRTGAVVHKGTYYIGLAPESYIGFVDKDLTINAVTVDWESVPVSGIPLEIVAYEHKWYSVQQQDDYGNYYWDSRYEDTAIYTETVNTDKEGRAKFTFQPPKGGVYKVAATGYDELGNRVRSSTYMWVSGRAYVNWRMDNDDTIDLIADKKEYAVGDTAQILIPSPYQGKVYALVTIERGQFLDRYVMEFTDNSETIDVPITEEFVPNVAVSVILAKGMDDTAPLGGMKVGYVNLPVSTAPKKLTVKLIPDKEQYSPREQVTYKIEARDYQGKGVAAEMSLNLVDKAVLALADGGYGDMLSTFWSQRGTGYQTSMGWVASVDRLNAEVAPEAKGGGGGGPGDEGFVRSRFPDTAYWNPTFRTAADGKGEVTVELPDNLTTWRMSARAVTADTRVGDAQVEIVSTKDLLVRPIAPRFFIIGDEVTLGAVVHNNTDRELKVEIEMSGEGLDGAGEIHEVAVAAGGKEKVQWDVKVTDSEQVRALFAARGGKVQDAIELTLPVYRYSTPEVVGTAGVLDEAGQVVEVVQFARPHEGGGTGSERGIDPTQGEITLNLAPSLAAGMREGLDYLRDFPYLCSEQTVSRFLPNVMTYRAMTNLGIKDSVLFGNLAVNVSKALQRLYKMQNYDGGWGWWGGEESNPYLTAYALLGMDKAAEAGFPVEERVMTEAAMFLLDYLEREFDVKLPYAMNSRAFILYVLAETANGDWGRTVALYEKRERLSNYGKAYLALALDLLSPDDPRTEALVSDLTSAALVSATGAHWEEATRDYWTMNTNLRSTAIVIDALVKLAPETKILPNAVRWLMMARDEGHWETTQETAWALIALTDYMEMTGELDADYDFEVTLNGAEWGAGTATKENVDETITLQMAVAKLLLDAGNQVAITRLPSADGGDNGRLYYTLHSRYYVPAHTVRALSRGIVVARQYCALTPDPSPGERGDSCPPIDTAQVGDVIEVKLTIVAPTDLHYVMVEDPIPAGTEALDLSLKTTPRSYGSPKLEKEGARRDWWWGDWWWSFSHTEVRDEKAVLFATYLSRGTYEYSYLIRASVPGTFNVLPTTASMMYMPEVWGRSDGMRFEVAE